MRGPHAADDIGGHCVETPRKPAPHISGFFQRAKKARFRARKKCALGIGSCGGKAYDGAQ
jgi:hypothetical protein